jgi:hypothetical protein
VPCSIRALWQQFRPGWIETAWYFTTGFGVALVDVGLGSSRTKRPRARLMIVDTFESLQNENKAASPVRSGT